MSFDPRDRLKRPFPGDAVDPDRYVDERLFAREQVEIRKDPVPPRDKKELTALTLRKTARVADPRPNAPLLIRIVRNPYGYAPDRPRRAAYIERAEAFVRVSATAEIRGALAEREIMRSTTAAGRQRPRPFAVRPSAWVLLPPLSGDDP